MQIVCQTHGMGEGEVICSKCVELLEQKINSLQQLQAKIAEEAYLLSGADVDMHKSVRLKIRSWYRQLSAVQ